MADRIRVFICYKKMLSRQEGDQIYQQKNVEADILQNVLSTDARRTYEAWVNNAMLTAGMQWETEIYRQLLASDVLVVLVGPGTSKSEWVRREIALANALGISIVPVGFDLSDERMMEETKELSISDLQWVVTRNIKFGRSAALLAELDVDLRRAAAATRERQRLTLDALWRRRAPTRKKAADAIGPMLDGLLGFLADDDNRDVAGTLRNIYISAYTQEDCDTVIATLEDRLAPAQ